MAYRGTLFRRRSGRNIARWKKHRRDTVGGNPFCSTFLVHEDYLQVNFDDFARANGRDSKFAARGIVLRHRPRFENTIRKVVATLVAVVEVVFYFADGLVEIPFVSF